MEKNDFLTIKSGYLFTTFRSDFWLSPPIFAKVDEFYNYNVS